METLLKYCYGNHPKSKKIKELGRKCILLLSQKGEMELLELAKALGIKTERWKGYEKPVKTFYHVVNPLKEIQIIDSVKRKEGRRFKTIYYYTPDKFEANMRAFVRNTLEFLREKIRN
ncbi:MAG: hypothetical protein GXO63_02085 [Candidatus Micrarchaeota archaeon]|nr:hypothetical protein [Candidatus Micrarchaeota archaeon]